MSQYESLDKIIIETINRAKGISFTEISSSQKMYNEITRLKELTGRLGYRILDGRLQALRKRGEIHYESKTGWHKGL